MLNTGRKRDAIWSEYTQISGRAKCNHCSEEMAGLVDRMKKHFHEVHGDLCPDQSDSPMPKRIQGIMDSHVVRTTGDQKKSFDLPIARFFYSTGTAFRTADSAEFKKMISALHPGYSPPNRADIAGPLLDEVHDTIKKTVAEKLLGKCVTLSVDCRTNVSNESILGFCAQEGEKTYLVSIEDVSDHSHTSEYLSEVVLKGIEKCSTEYNFIVTGLVTDNAET